MKESLKQRLEREVIDWKEKYDAERTRADDAEKRLAILDPAYASVATELLRVETRADRLEAQGAERREAREYADTPALNELRVPHLIVEDCWYSCPKSGECCDERQDPTMCNCGADALNEGIDKLRIERDRWREQAEHYKTEADQAHARINKMFLDLRDHRVVLLMVLSSTLMEAGGHDWRTCPEPSCLAARRLLLSSDDDSRS